MTSTDHSSGPSLSLSSQLSILLLVLAALTFVSSVLVSTSNMRSYLDAQLAQSAQDTANSLGLSISPYVGADLTVAETMIAAIFDSGAYLSMNYIDTSQQVVFDRSNNKQTDAVPDWFISMFALEPPVMQSEINDGWKIAGTLRVQAHPGHAYTSLWNHTKAVFWNSLLLCLLALVAVHLLLMVVLKPLKDIEKQARLLAEKRFELLDYMPLTTELRTVVQALNHMVSHVRRNFSELNDRAEQLNQQVYLDALTALPNRRALVQSFSALQQSPADAGHNYLALVSLSSLKHINDQQGYASGDQYVQKAAELLASQVRQREGAQLFRLSGSEFAVLARFGENSAAEFALTLQQTFAIADGSAYPQGFATLSLLQLMPDEELSHAMARADGALAQQANLPSPATPQSAADPLGLINPLSRSHWQDILHTFTRSVVSDTAAGNCDTRLGLTADMQAMFALELQPVFAGQQLVYTETFVRFRADQQQLPSADVFAMAERLGVSLLLDKALVTYILSQLRGLTSQKFAINLSKSALHDEQFVRWLVRLIENNRAELPQLVFEVNEQATLGAISSAQYFFDSIKQAGAAITIERFGASFSSFRYLQGLNVDFIKIDGSYIRALHEADTRFFVDTMTHICHGIGIRVIAAQVENVMQVEHCQALHLDGLQGNALHPAIKFSEFQQKVAAFSPLVG
jgi:diguanylate cyclase (GGDEF)-like protein